MERFWDFDHNFASFWTILDPKRDRKPQLASQYGFSGLFEVACKFINHLFKVTGFLWPHILKIVQFWDFEHNFASFWTILDPK